MASLRELEIDEISLQPPTVQWPLELQRISAADISYGDFFTRFMQTNTAVIVTSVADHWECYRRWVNRNENGIDKIDVNYLKARIENLTVPVSDCGKMYSDYQELLKCNSKINFHDFLDCLNDGKERSNLYLKDWHLREAMPEYRFYETPMFFASDWLNEYLVDRKQSDYMFVYIGPKETWTRFHVDVFWSYSWSINICGVKKWLLLPVGEESKLKDSLGNFPVEISEELLTEKGVFYYNVLQKAGEAMFVPTGWYHQVQNLEDTISVNHNWFNGCNISNIWNSLHAQYEAIVEEIAEFKDTEGFGKHCQLMLKACFWMDMETFLDMLVHICNKRIEALKSNDALAQFDIYKLGKNHAKFDLIAIDSVLKRMLEKSDLLEVLKLLARVVDCIQSINKCIYEYAH